MGVEMGERLTVRVDRTTRPVVIVGGEVDADSVRTLDQVLNQLEDPHVALDLGSVSFCDTRGLECLIRHRVGFRYDGRLLEVIRRSEPVDRIMTLTDTGRFFDDPR